MTSEPRRFNAVLAAVLFDDTCLEVEGSTNLKARDTKDPRLADEAPGTKQKLLRRSMIARNVLYWRQRMICNSKSCFIQI
jgi:hypothetical protein